MATNEMDSAEGVSNLDVAVSGKGGIADLTDKQLDTLGGERDEIDDFDPAEMDRGDDFDPDLVDRLLREAKEKESEREDPEKAEAAPEEDNVVPEPDGDGDAEGEVQVEAAGDSSEESTEDTSPEKADPEPEVKAEEDRTGWIPKSRFDEVNQRRKEAETALAEREANEQAAEEAKKNAYDFESAEKAYMGLVLDGKEDEAVAKRAEIRAAELATFQAETAPVMRETVESVQSKRDIANIIARAEESFAEFDPSNEETYSNDLVKEVGALYGSYQSLGHAAPDAFELAVDAVSRLYGLTDRLAVTPEVVEAAPEAPAPNPIKKTAAKLEQAKSAPPPVSDTGVAGDAAGLQAESINIANLSDEEMEALPPSTLARLRGDIV